MKTNPANISTSLFRQTFFTGSAVWGLHQPKQEMGGGDYVVSSGFCYQLHKAKPQRFDCFGSFVNMIKGAICMVMFVYILAKMNTNHRRALAGYTKNTVGFLSPSVFSFSCGLTSDRSISMST
jgi:hypothetical protein